MVPQYRFYDSLDLTRPNQNKIKYISCRVHTFVFPWVLNSWTDISTATPDPVPERITETHLDLISLVSHPGVHHGRAMSGSFFKKKKMRIVGIFTALAINIASSPKYAALSCHLSRSRWNVHIWNK